MFYFEWQMLFVIQYVVSISLLLFPGWHLKHIFVCVCVCVGGGECVCACVRACGECSAGRQGWQLALRENQRRACWNKTFWQGLSLCFHANTAHPHGTWS